MKIRRRNGNPPAAINVVPMIDVVFALLTFFIMSTLFLSRSEGLLVNLPQATMTKPQPPVKIAVTLKADGQLALNKQSIQLDQIEPGIRVLMMANQPTVVVIHADEKAEHGQVIAVMDQVKKIQGVGLAIATKPKDTERP
jgi:biopolymer transport protein ExbD